MRTLLAALAATFLLAAPPAHAQPLVAAPDFPTVCDASPCQAAAQVSGTRWQGLASWTDGETKYWNAYFRPDGVLEYGYEGARYDNGRWTQNGALVTWHTNTYFALYAGTLSNNAITGTMHNRNGSNGVFIFVPQE